MAQQIQRPMAGQQLIDGQWVLSLLALTQLDSQGDITALSGGGLSASTPDLVNGLNRVATVAVAADSVALPAAKKGSVIFLANASANAVTVFSRGSGDLINATAGSAGLSQAGSTHAVYFCAQDGYWSRILSA
jgi:hypothetical protein